MRPLLLAIQLLTIVPVRVRGEVTDREMVRAAAFFPAAGALQGIAAAAIALALLQAFPAGVAAAAAIAALYTLTGGLHIDGLADTFDALAVKGTGDPAVDRARRLEVMKDSHTGAIGAAAITCAVVAKYALTAALLGGRPPLAACALLALTPVFSKLALVIAAHHGTAARPDGLGRIYLGSTGAGVLAGAALLAMALAAPSCFVPGVGPMTAVRLGAALIVVYIGTRFAVSWLSHRFGGLTGDTLGTIAEGADITFLLVMAACLPPST